MFVQQMTVEDSLLALADGMDPREVAARNGMTLGQLRLRLQDAIRRLNAEVDEELARLTRAKEARTRGARNAERNRKSKGKGEGGTGTEGGEAVAVVSVAGGGGKEGGGGEAAVGVGGKPARQTRRTGVALYKYLQDAGRMVRWGVKMEAVYRHMSSLALDPAVDREARMRIGLALLAAGGVSKQRTAGAGGAGKPGGWKADGGTRLEAIDDPVQQRISAGLALLAEKERRENAG